MSNPTTGKTSSGVRWLIGCLIAFAVAAFVGVLLTMGAMWYAFSTPEQIAGADLVGPQSVAVIEVRGDLHDEGVSAMANTLADAFGALTKGPGSGGTPIPGFDAILGRANQMNLRRLIPDEVTVLAESVGEGGTLEMVVVVALKTLPRMYEKTLTLLLSAAPAGTEGGPISHGEHTLIRTEGDAVFTITSGTILYATSLEAMIQVLDRLDSNAEGGPLADEFAALAQRDDGRFVAQLDAPGVRDEVEARGRKPLDCSWLRGTIDVLDGDTIDARAQVTCADRESYEIVELIAHSAAEEIEETFTGLSVSLTIEAGTEHTTIVAHMTGIEAAIQDGLKPPPVTPLPAEQFVDPTGRE